MKGIVSSTSFTALSAPSPSLKCSQSFSWLSTSLYITIITTISISDNARGIVTDLDITKNEKPNKNRKTTKDTPIANFFLFCRVPQPLISYNITDIMQLCQIPNSSTNPTQMANIS